MSAEIWVAIITGVFSVLGVIITVVVGNKKQAKNTEKYQNTTLYRINQLEKKQDKHNTLIERMYKIEGRMTEAEHDIKDLKRR